MPATATADNTLTESAFSEPTQEPTQEPMHEPNQGPNQGPKQKTPRKRARKALVLPMLPLRGIIIFPSMIIHIDVGRDKSVAALEESYSRDQRVFFAMQIDAQETSPRCGDCHDVGTIAIVRQVTRLQDGSARVLAEGLSRARVVRALQEEPYIRAELEPMSDEDTADMPEKTALHRTVIKLLAELSQESGHVSQDAVAALGEISDSGQLSDIVAANTILNLEKKQRILSETSQIKRLELLCEYVMEEKQIAALEQSVQARLQRQIEKHQREAYLNEQMQAIRSELGEGGGIPQALREKYETVKEYMNEEAREKVEQGLVRLQRTHPEHPEAQILTNKLDWLVNMPWKPADNAHPSLKDARDTLERDHYGLKDVKQRLVEFLAVRSRSSSLKTPILCLIGAPGVGKTSVAQSVASAMGRKFTRMSLGGLRDEAEIRGHRSTYIGAMPGGLIAGIKRTGVSNPVFLLDEIDKLGMSIHGDPASALLEALDPEQNSTFRDLFLDVPYPLSDVLFITTANTQETIPRPLLDRMEIIEIPSYTNLEKMEIGKRYLLPKQMKAHGLDAASFKLPGRALQRILNGYTREAGVREFERCIAAVCRKAAFRLMESSRGSIVINNAHIDDMLGQIKYLDDHIEDAPQAGIVNGLAFTTVGGSTLQVECAVAPGSGSLEITGNLGDVMKESARAAMSFIRSHAGDLGLSPDFYKTTDIHVHVPEGAVPKDGPSAGVTLTCAMVSALTGRKARQDVAMSGEITLRGRVLPIGGVREKVMAAYRSGVKIVMLPEENMRDLRDVPEQAKAGMSIVSLRTVGDALNTVLMDI